MRAFLFRNRPEAAGRLVASRDMDSIGIRYSRVGENGEGHDAEPMFEREAFKLLQLIDREKR